MKTFAILVKGWSEPLLMQADQCDTRGESVVFIKGNNQVGGFRWESVIGWWETEIQQQRKTPETTI